MKYRKLRAWAAACAVILSSGCSTIQDMDRPEQAWHALNVIDGAQTMNFCYPQMYEANPLLGRYPSDAEVAAWITAFSLGYHYLRRWIKDEHPDGLRAFDTLTLTIKGYVILHNYNLMRREC